VTDVTWLVEECFAKHADDVAVVDATGILTFADLRERVVGQQAALARAGVGAGAVVALDLDRSVDELVAVLALLRMGAAWSAVDPRAPDARLRSVLGTLRPRAVWASDAARAERLQRLCPSPCTAVSPSRLTEAPVDEDEPVAAAVDDETPAHVAFTSGSTGTPKGVVVPRRAVAALVQGAEDYVRTGPGERFLRMAPLAFDASTFEIFCALGTGAAVVVDDTAEFSAEGLKRLIAERGVTVAWFTAGLFRLLVDEEPDAFAPLRQAVTGGDVVPADQVRILAATHEHLVITNGYGPTENTTFTSTWTLGASGPVGQEIPIGQPVRGCRTVVLSEDGDPVAPGEVGELLVSGTGLATGYMGDQEATDAAFVSLPSLPGVWYRTGDLVVQDDDGVLRFRGRRDRQVKVRGFRIELGEVEHCLRAHAGVRDAEVLLVPGPSGPSVLAAAIVCQDGVSEEAVRLHATESLPTYAIPVSWLVVDALPLSPNGKVDHTALGAMLASRPARTTTDAVFSAAAMSPPADLEALVDLVVQVWTDVLGTDDFDDDESFFDVGGDSISVVAVHARLQQAMPGTSIRMVDLMSHPTARDVAGFLHREGVL
jgi:amino acid adenylation domain-containing protein